MTEPQQYLHGYSKQEQKRLRYQAKILERYVYDFIDLKKVKNLLEIGCGVGAQTEILLKKFPKIHITGIDISNLQLNAAQQFLKKEVSKKRVEFIQADATQIPVKNSSHDGAFICWFLEHVPEPLKVLEEAYKKLSKGAVIYCTEVQNSGVFVEPYSPAILRYWYELNDLQWTEKGHPFVGAQLGHLLRKTGFKKIEHNTQVMLFDSRNPVERTRFISYFTDLMMSASPQLLKHNRIDQKLLDEVKNEMSALASNKDSVIFFPFCRAKAYK